MTSGVDNLTPFDSERATAAINARWAAEREKRAELEREAKDKAVAELVAASTEAATELRALLQDGNAHVRLRASVDILDRLLGKALERHEHAGPEGSSLLRGDIDPETLQLALKELLAGAGSNGDGPT